MRIEDTDQAREVEGATDIIYDTLKSVGMNWDEGPDIGGDFGPYIQSERLPMYRGYADQLIELGKPTIVSVPKNFGTTTSRTRRFFCI